MTIGNDAMLTALETRLSRIENFLVGTRAVFVGNDRVLTKANFLNLLYLVDSTDRLIVPRFIMDGVFEAEVTSYFLRTIKADARCVDIGANFGYYTCLMSRLASQGTTLGIEADPETFELLRDNVAINWLEKRARVMNLAISDNDEPITLYRRDRRSGNTSIINLGAEAAAAHGEKPAEPFSIQTSSLDALVAEPINFLKIDIEGAEPLAFRGAKGAIHRSPDIRVVMEWSPAQIKAAGFSPSDLVDELTSIGLHPHSLAADGRPTAILWSEVLALDLANLLLARTVLVND